MSYYEFTIKMPEQIRASLIQKLMDTGCLGVVEDNEGVTAYFPDTADIKMIRSDISIMGMLVDKSGMQGSFTFDHHLIHEQDWNENWKKTFQPLDVGDHFTILPPWEKKHPGRANIIIDPGMAFGTGHHATTRSCLFLIEKYSAWTSKNRFLDLGTGTGLLALAGSMLAFKDVIAVDTDPLSVDAARLNAQLNDISNMDIRLCSIDEISGGFDFIAANIISGVLASLAPQIASKLNLGGIAALSGILSGQENEVIREFENAGLRIIERYFDDKWVSLVVLK